MPKPRNPPWAKHELAILREIYPQGGLDAVTDLLADRSWHSIYQKAHKLGIRCEKVTAAPKGKLQGAPLEEAIRLREVEGWGFERIGVKFGVCETSASNAILTALCTRNGFTPAEREASGRLTPRGIERLRLALKKGLKPVDIQLRLGLSAGRIALERKRYNTDLQERGLALLPPPGGGEQYSGVKLPAAKKREIEALFMLGLGSQKIHERTAASQTSIGRVRGRLVKRLKRKGETLPGCDGKGVRHAQAESSRFVPDGCIQAVRAMLLQRVPVNRAAKLAVVGSCRAYRIRDELKAELAARGETLPPPKLPGRVKGGGYPVDPHWPPSGPREIYAFRELLRDMEFEDAKAHWRQARRKARIAEATRPKSFEEQLERIARGEIGITRAAPRAHLEPTAAPESRVA